MADNKVSEEEARKVFDKLDADKSGSLDAAEFFELAGTLGFLLDKAETDAALVQIDESKDGQVQFDEFYKWLSSAEVGKKGKAQQAKLKAALMTKRGQRKLKKLQGLAGDAGEPTSLTIRVGDQAKVDKASCSARVGQLGQFLDEAKVADAFASVAIEIETADNVSPDYFETVAKLIGSMVQDVAQLSVSSPEAGVTRISVILPKATVPQDAQEQLSEQIGMVKGLIGEAATQLNLGINPRTLTEPGFGFNKEFLNLRVSLNGNVPPPVTEMLNGEMMEMLPPPIAALPFMANLQAGDKKIDCDLTDFVFGMFEEVAAPMLEELGIKEPTFAALLGVVAGKIAGEKEPIMALAAARIAILTQGQFIKSLKAARVRTSDGYGADVEFKGVNIDDIFALVDFVANTVTAKK